MMVYLIKSILTLGILYIFYWFFLRNLKTFTFNRFFLLSALVFSLIIPLITIPVKTPVVSIIPAESSLQIEKTIQFSGEFISDSNKQESSFFSLLPLFYVGISLILLIRFCINVVKIFRTIRTNQSIKQNGYQLILVEKRILPHSFFKYIFINQAQYKTGEINNALIEHESTHCRQWHSTDIIFAELVKLVFWINPFIWLIRKQMQLNHEFLADHSVLTSNDITQYRNLLLNTILKNQTGILVSNFNFSFTKQRLKMMLKPIYLRKAITLNIVSIAVLILVGYAFMNFQNVNKIDIIQSEVIVNTNKFDYLIDTEYTDENGLEGLTRNTRLWTTHKNGEITGQTHFTSNGYKIVTSERFIKNEESNVTVHHIYDLLVLNDEYKTCTGCLQSTINKDRILSIHPVSGVTKDTIHATYKIDKETLKYQLVDYNNYEWVHEGPPDQRDFEELKKKN